MIYYEEVNFLPTIPKELINSLEEIESFENVFPYPDFKHTYASYKVPKTLENFLQDFFDYSVVVRYQVIKQDLPIHVDVGINGIKYNYLLDTGGDSVITRFWDKIESSQRILFEVKSKSLSWHWLRIDTPHDVTGVEHPRISVTVKKKS